VNPDELLTTTRAVRKRLDLETPVPRDVVEECLRLAFQAPNGSNQQTWRWVVVDDPAVRAQMADIYRAGMDSYVSRPRDDDAPAPDYSSPAAQRISSSVMHLREHLHEVPVLVVPTLPRRLEGADIFDQASVWGSVLPAVWSFMLALRSRGLGSAWTTIHLHREREMAELLGIPYERVTQAGLFPVAYTLGTDFKPGDREASARAIRWNGWRGDTASDPGAM
jgi:nitroreductase